MIANVSHYRYIIRYDTCQLSMQRFLFFFKTIFLFFDMKGAVTGKGRKKTYAGRTGGHPGASVDTLVPSE